MKLPSKHRPGQAARFMGSPRHWLLAAALAAAQAGVFADVLPPQAAEAARRLRENPQSFDRVDNFCQGRKPGAACTIDGSHFAGGGEGRCESAINRSSNTIDLSCQRTANVFIDDGLPDGGFVADSSLCSSPEDVQAAARGQRPWNCTPLPATPADRFCRGKPKGAACTVTLSYDGRVEQHPGVCNAVTERQGFYYMGRRTMTREVIRCEPPQAPAARTWTDATWWQKLTQ